MQINILRIGAQLKSQRKNVTVKFQSQPCTKDQHKSHESLTLPDDLYGKQIVLDYTTY